MSDIQRYFEVCGYEPDDLIGLGTRAGAEGNIQFTVKTVAEAAKQIGYQGHINVWFNACPIERPEKGRGTAKDVTRVSALWADLDVKEGGREKRAMRSMEDAWSVVHQVSEFIGARPVAIVLSGHGLQPRWRLAEDLPNDHPETARIVRDFNRLVDHIASRFDGGADTVGDLARILRAPGTTNLKPGLDPVVVQVQFPPANQGDTVDLAVLEDAFDDYLPALVTTPTTDMPRATSVDLARGSKWLQAALDGIKADLVDAQGWAEGYTKTVVTQNGEQQIGWDKLTADKAKRLASLVVADWCPLTEEEAYAFLMEHAPRGEGWGDEQIQRKWDRELAQAVPALPPVEKVAQSVDPLEDNYVAPKELPLANEPRAEMPVNNDWPVFAQTDKGYAARLAHRYGDSLRFSPKLDAWLRYDQGRWVEDKLGGQKAAHDLTDVLYELEGGQYDDTNEYQIGNRVTTDRREFQRWVRGQEATSRVKAASDMLKASAVVNVELSEFDSNVKILNAADCAVDIQEAQMIPHSPELMMRRKTPVNYNPNAKAPEWEAFLQQAQPDQEMRDFVQRVVGYSLTGMTSEQVIFLHRGPTRSGKSVFLRVLSAVLGEYARPMPESLLLNKNTEAHPTGIAGLEGCRVVYTDETAQGARWDEAVLKRLTGETPITARGMHQDFRDFRLTAKVHIVTNYPPHLSSDEATHRRLVVVPWDRTVPLSEVDQNLAERIVENELEGVLAWAVRGAQTWARDTLRVPEAAMIAKAKYIQEEDEFGEWIGERTVDTGQGGFLTPTRMLYQDYRMWVQGRGGSPMQMTTFGKELERRKKVQGRTKTARGWYMALQTALDDAQDPLETRR